MNSKDGMYIWRRIFLFLLNVWAYVSIIVFLKRNTYFYGILFNLIAYLFLRHPIYSYCIMLNLTSYFFLQLTSDFF